jgi:hypothetical protein
MGDSSVGPSLCRELRSVSGCFTRPSRRDSSARGEIRHFYRHGIAVVDQHLGNLLSFERSSSFL